MTKIALCGALIGLISSLSAQDPASDAKKLRDEAQALVETKVLSASMINGPTVKGAPYSAQAVNEMVQVLADGNRITNTSTSALYRDSQGRERREENSSGASPTVRSIFITDPVESVNYVLEPNSKVAHKSGQRVVNFTDNFTTRGGAGAGVGVGGGPVGPITTETRTLVLNSPGSGPETFFFSNQEVGSVKRKPVVEDLGTQMMEGISATGTRTTITIPAGLIGNEQPIVTVTERWYSPELQVTVMNKRSDPRTGTTTYRLTNINRAEPAPTLFQVPSDYTISEPEIRRMIFNKFEEQR
jgi:hypothetical protein